MSEYYDEIDKLPADNVKLDQKQINIATMLLGSSQVNNFSMWKILLLLLIVMACIAPIPQLKNYNTNSVFIGKVIFVLLTFVLLFYVF